jgi:hypothetical protein
LPKEAKKRYDTVVSKRHRYIRSLTVSALGLGVVAGGWSLALPHGSRPAQAAAAVHGELAPAGPVIAAAAPALAPALAPVSGAQIPQVRHVVVISEDGMRPELIYQQQSRMQWHEQLYRNGAYSWKARTIRTASTLPSHASMLSGVDVNLHKLTWNNWRPAKGYIHAPTVFHTAEEHGLKTAAFVGKFKLRHILPAGTVDVFERPGYYCKKVSDEAARHIEREKPTLTFVHFSDPDEAGHSRGWMSESQKRAALAADACLGTIYRALERAGILDETLVIVSADHGGHNHNHSGALASDREIPWIAAGPRVRRGYNIRSSVSTMDTAATVLAALGLRPNTKLTGKPVTEIFQ